MYTVPSACAIFFCLYPSCFWCKFEGESEKFKCNICFQRWAIKCMNYFLYIKLSLLNEITFSWMRGSWEAEWCPGSLTNEQLHVFLCGDRKLYMKLLKICEGDRHLYSCCCQYLATCLPRFQGGTVYLWGGLYWRPEVDPFSHRWHVSSCEVSGGKWLFDPVRFVSFPTYKENSKLIFYGVYQ